MKAIKVIVLPPLYLVGFIIWAASEALGWMVDGIQHMIERIESL